MEMRAPVGFCARPPSTGITRSSSCLNADLFVTGAGAFPTDIDDLSAFCHHLARSAQRGLDSNVVAAIGKAVGGNIEYAHDAGMPAEAEDFAIGQR